MNILVTGSAGFIGRHVVNVAQERGHSVTEVDYKNGYSKGGFDIRDHPIQDFDAIIHLAAYIDIAESFNKAWEYVDNNINTLKYLTEAKRVVFASSAAVYGSFSPYGYSKRLGEALLPENSISLRLFNPFGPGENHKPENHIIPLLAQNAIDGKVTKLYHYGEQTRDFIHVHDVALAFVMAAESDATGAYDLCDTPLTVKKVADLMKVDYELVGDARDAGDTLELIGDSNPLAAAIGFEPTKDVKEMIKGWRYWY